MLTCVFYFSQPQKFKLIYFISKNLWSVFLMEEEGCHYKMLYSNIFNNSQQNLLGI